MDRRLAVFVEGMTEQVFMQRLLLELAGQNNVQINLIEVRGSSSARLISMEGVSDNETRYYAIICDCGADNSVASDIRDNYDRLSSSGFVMVLGLRDVFPRPSAEIPQIRDAIQSILPKGSVPVHVVLAVREIEAWFIVEDRHFQQINPNLTPVIIRDNLGIDTTSVVAENIQQPARLLDQAYRLVGRAYGKRRSHVQQTVGALDYARMYVDLRSRVSALDELCGHVDRFLSLPSALDGKSG